MKTIAFFNNKGGVGKTSLVYHLSCMYADLGLTVVAADLDPQANLTAMFLEEDDLQSLWPERGPSRTVLAPILPLLEGTGAIGDPSLEKVGDVHLLAGDLGLSSFEDELSQMWPRCLDGQKRAFLVTGAFHEVLRRASDAVDADVVLIDVGPNLGAVNRAALIAAEHVVIPLAPDLFSLKGLQNLGPRLRQWRKGWQERLEKAPDGMALSRGAMDPMGYLVMQHAVRLDRPVKAYEKWMARIPVTYRDAVLGEVASGVAETNLDQDPHCLATLKHYRSLMPLAQEARKPMFALRPADGAIGGHAEAVQACYRDFRSVARRIAELARVGLP